jgi:hypothetical protein
MTNTYSFVIIPIVTVVDLKPNFRSFTSPNGIKVSLDGRGNVTFSTAENTKRPQQPGAAL